MKPPAAWTAPLLVALFLAPAYPAPAPPDRRIPEAAWLAAQRERLKKTSAVTLQVQPGAQVRRDGGKLALPATITNRSAAPIRLRLTREWHGGQWPPTHLYASVTPAGAAKCQPFHPVYLLREGPGGFGREVSVAPGKSVKVELRMDWPGTGSCPARPLIDPAASGAYQVRLLLVVEAGGKRYAVGGPARVDLPAK